MGTIAFSEDPEESWVVAGWAFRQVLDDTVSRYPRDPEIARTFEEAKAISGLIVYKMEPIFATRVTKAIQSVATGILSGTIRSGILDQRYCNEQTVEEYRKGLEELLKAISAGNR
jgi:hypothetical protein